jgi:hypothetical protein
VLHEIRRTSVGLFFYGSVDPRAAHSEFRNFVRLSGLLEGRLTMLGYFKVTSSWYTVHMRTSSPIHEAPRWRRLAGEVSDKCALKANG